MAVVRDTSATTFHVKLEAATVLYYYFRSTVKKKKKKNEVIKKISCTLLVLLQTVLVVFNPEGKFSFHEFYRYSSIYNLFGVEMHTVAIELICISSLPLWNCKFTHFVNVMHCFCSMTDCLCFKPVSIIAELWRSINSISCNFWRVYSLTSEMDAEEGEIDIESGSGVQPAQIFVNCSVFRFSDTGYFGSLSPMWATIKFDTMSKIIISDRHHCGEGKGPWVLLWAVSLVIPRHLDWSSGRWLAQQKTKFL